MATPPPTTTHTFHRQAASNECDGGRHVPIDFSCAAPEAATGMRVKLWRRFLLGEGAAAAAAAVAAEVPPLRLVSV